MQGNVNIPDSTIQVELTFRKLCLMNLQQLTNFPYIEKDFDALTDYELLCLVVKYLNDVIANQNEQNDTITNMYNAFLALQTYVNNTKDDLEDAFNELDDYVRNYFDNLDVQDEIDHKIDEMIENGDFQEIIMSYVGERCYPTTLAMIADETLTVNTLVKTSGYSEANDGKGSSYIIVNTSTRNGYLLNNGLYAEVIENDGISRQANSTKNAFVVEGNKLSGVCKARNPIDQTADYDYAVNVKYNECLLENLRITNSNNYADKTAILVTSPSQRDKFDSIYITNGFKTGIKIPNAYYSEFIDVWTSGDVGIEIGEAGHWIGVLDFNACHFNSSVLAFKELSTDTNTICLDKCSFEGNVKCIENAGVVYARNTYFGDTKSTTDSQVGLLDAQSGSETHFDNCTLGLTFQNYGDTTDTSLFNLKGNATKGAKVYINGGIMQLSNQGTTSSLGAIYSSTNAKDEIYLDNVKFIPSTANSNHNQFPYTLLNGYSPLRSLNPIKNYIINGTFKDSLMNSIAITRNDNDVASFDANLINPFGGKCITYTRPGEKKSGHTTLYYKIPKSLVGKEMVLEVYAWSNSQYLAINSSNLGLSYQQLRFDTGTTSSRTRPRLRRRIVTPTAETGIIDILLHWNDNSTTSSYLLAGVILKELKYEEMLSCYEDQDIKYSSTIPTDTTNAIKGDIVYAIQSVSGTIGWIFDGTAWQVYQPYTTT